MTKNFQTAAIDLVRKREITETDLKITDLLLEIAMISIITTQQIPKENEDLWEGLQKI